MIKITKKLIKQIIEMENLTDQDYLVLHQFIKNNLLKSIIIGDDALVIKALKKYNLKNEAEND